MGQKLSAAVILAAVIANIAPVFAQNAGSSGYVYDPALPSTKWNQIWSPGANGPLTLDNTTGLLRTEGLGPSYQLLGTPGVGGAAATGSPVLVTGGVYTLNCLGTIGGATLQPQAIGADKTTWVNGVTASGGATAITTLPTTTTVYVGSSIGSVTPNVRIQVTGGSPSGLYCVLSGAPAGITTTTILLPGQSPDVLPGSVLYLAAGSVTPSTVPLTWSAPSYGTGTITYNVFYRLSGTTLWTAFTSQAGTSVTVTGLASSTAYDFQVIALNNLGSGPAAILSSVSTTSAATNYVLDGAGGYVLNGLSGISGRILAQ